MYPHLSSPLRLRNVTLRNRVVSSAHGTRLADGASDSQTERGVPSRRTMEYHLRRAEGGVGLIITEPTVVFPLDETWIAGWRPVVDALHERGVVVFAQLIYGGSQTTGRQQLRPVFAPSAIPWEPGGEVPRAMSERNIGQMVASFARAGELAVAAGFDGVEIHGAHGYLVHEFLSPLYNLRTDGYGGDVVARSRFAAELLSAVRSSIGDGPVLGIRLSGAERVPGGITTDDQIRTIGLIRSTVDYVSVSAGSYKALDSVIPSMYKPSVVNEPLAREIRRAHPDLTLFLAGRITSPADAEAVLAAGTVDATIMTRALVADPDLPRKAFEGRDEEIRHCMGANQGCWGRVRAGFHISCVLNPDTGREREAAALTRAQAPRKVLVVGGGPAGCEAARQAALRGHEVTLWERGGDLGGMIAVAARAPRREDFTEVARFYGQELRRLGVTVEFGREATGESVEEFAADAVILAIGGRPVTPTVPGAAENPYWASVVDALTMRFDPGQHAVVYSVSKNIDPMTVADLLAERGAHVTLVTPHARPGADVDDATFPAVMGRLQDRGVDVVTGSILDAIDGGAVRLRGAYGGSARTLPEPDTLILDLGWEPAEELSKLQAAISAPVQVIGDAFAARGLQAAVWDGSRAGRAVR